MKDPRKPRVDARALAARLSKEAAALREREIIAPLLPGGRLRTRVSGMVHEFRLKATFTGWGRFRPINEREVELLGEAQPWERGGYLELFPMLRVLLLWPLPAPHPQGTWLALPFNESDAQQRFGLGMQPITVFLCDPLNGAERFERVLTRVDGTVVWFEGPDLLADPLHGEWLRDASAQVETAEEPLLKGLAGSQRLALLFWRIRQVEQAMGPQALQATALSDAERLHNTTQYWQDLRDYRQAQARIRENIQRRSVEGMLRHELTKADAVLHSYSELPRRDGESAQIVVEWSEHGHIRRYRSTIDARMNTVSSGICLSGRDRDFDLASLVSVMTASHSRWDD